MILFILVDLEYKYLFRKFDKQFFYCTGKDYLKMQTLWKNPLYWKVALTQNLTLKSSTFVGKTFS